MKLLWALAVVAAAAASDGWTAPRRLTTPEAFELDHKFLSEDDKTAAVGRLRGHFGRGDENRLEHRKQYLRRRGQRMRNNFNGDRKGLDKMSARVEGAMRHAPSIAEINSPISDYLYGSDIMLPEEQIDDDIEYISTSSNDRRKRGAPIVTSTRWSKTRPIAYVFNASFPTATRLVVRSAMDIITSNTCLSFKENATEGTQLLFHLGGGCWSYIGNAYSSSNQQLISLDTGCGYIGIASHEITHALGLSHTQTRKDRDAYVSINIAAISTSAKNNFAINSDTANDNFGVPYDFGSDMHYGTYDFSSSGQAIIVPKTDADAWVNTMGQRKGLTFNDFKMINILYKCNETCKNVLTCQNGGYQSPKDCTKCVCPDFYTGTNCQTAVNPLTATATAQKITWSVAYNQALYTSGNNYNWTMFQKDQPRLISVAAGKKIKVTINKIYAAYGGLACYLGCPFVGIQFTDSADGDMTTLGKIYCCTKDQGFSFVSKSNKLGYRAFASPGMPLDTDISYQISS